MQSEVVHMKKIIKLLANNRGNTHFYGITIILCIIIIFVGLFEFSRVIYTANTFKKEMQLCVDSFTMELAKEGFERVRRITVEEITSDFIDYYNNYMGDKFATSTPEITFEVNDDKTLTLRVKTDLVVTYYLGTQKVTDIDLNINFTSRFRFI